MPSAMIQQIATTRQASLIFQSLYAPIITCCIRGRDNAALIRRPIQQSLIQTRSKRTGTASKNSSKKAISRAIASNNKRKQSTSGSNSETVDALFGLHPIDYSIPPPIRYSPPPPPAKPGLQKYLFPFTLLFTAGTVVYFYVNNKNDNYAYWEAMQSGEALQLDDDEDDEEDDEEE